MSYGLFDYINDLCDKKELLAFKVKNETLSFPKELNAFILNKAFGNYQDTILYANEVNKFNIPIEALYLFYTYGISKKRRYAKWYKGAEHNEHTIKNLMRHFQWGKQEAEINIKMLSEAEIAEINMMYEELKDATE